MMDLQTALVGAAIFIVSLGVLLFIAMYGIKQKSYEEALAEQRQQTNSLLGLQNRTKSKEKKQKKTGKKVKEKQPASSTSNKNELEEEAEVVKQSSAETDGDAGAETVKHHVEFKEPTAVEEPVKENISKKRIKRDRVRPILVNKDMSEETVILDETCETPSANHFEQLHPKDDFELLQSHLKEEQAPPVKEKINKAKQSAEISAEPKISKKAAKHEATAAPPAVTEVKQNSEAPVEQAKNSSKKTSKQINEVVAPPPVTEKEEVIAVIPQTNGVITTTVVKDKKKKKNELNTLHQLTGDKQGVNLAFLTTLVRKAELSRSEIQNLIDLLLNKQHEAPAVLDEWSEGKADPIQKLKKQLAEKEKLLIEDQEALTSAQAKLKEVRAEQAAERSQLQQRARTLEETLQGKQHECQTTTNHLHSITKNLQQVQMQLNEEIMNKRNLMEELAALQMQRQQFEHHLVQLQEAQNSIAQLQNDLQDLKGHNNQLTKELMGMNEQNDRNQSAMMQCQHKLGHFTNEIEQKNEIIRQMEEANTELEHRLSKYHKQENDSKHEISQLKSTFKQQAEEIRSLELSNQQSLSDIRHFQDQKNGLEALLNQLKAEKMQLQDEKQQLEMTIKNGSLEEDKNHKIEVMNLHNEISSFKTQLEQTEIKHVAELDTNAKKFQLEIEELKNRNNELRKRNWKMIEALKAAESSSSSSSNSHSGPNLDATIDKVRQDEQDIYRNLIQRLFPSIKLSGNVPQGQWISDAEKAIEDYISSLQSTVPSEPSDNSEVTKLQAQILNYKSVIDDTEGMLNKLQAHIEQEEINWRKQLKAKEAEIETLKQQQIKETVEPNSAPEIQGVQFAYECIEKSLPAVIDELQIQLAALEEQLRVEQEAKQRLTEEYHSYKNTSKPQADTIVQVEKLYEDVNRLSEALRVEQTKNIELQSQIGLLKTENHNTSNGPSINLENNGK